jgi:hypothetical protein
MWLHETHRRLVEGLVSNTKWCSGDVACPDCGSWRTARHVFGDGMMDFILARHYPRSRDCLACGHLWDEERRVRETQMRKLALSSIGKAP